MLKARLVITAVVTEGRSQGEAARAYGVSQGWASKLVARYRAEGEAAFEPRSRRPKTSPKAIGAEIADEWGGWGSNPRPADYENAASPRWLPHQRLCRSSRVSTPPVRPFRTIPIATV